MQSNDEPYKKGTSEDHKLTRKSLKKLEREEDDIQETNESTSSTGIGKKRTRGKGLASALVRALIKSVQVAEKREERHEREKEQIRSELSSQASTYQGGELGFLKRERGKIESSKGEWKSALLDGAELPPEWPEYRWPKSWVGRFEVVRALNLMNLHQKTHKKGKTDLEALRSAVRELKTNLKSENRLLKRDEFRLISPIIKGDNDEQDDAETDEYIFAHDVWELCCIGFRDIGPQIPGWLFICRSVNPNLMESEKHWTNIIGGGEWPRMDSSGFKVGFSEPIKKTQKPSGPVPKQPNGKGN